MGDQHQQPPQQQQRMSGGGGLNMPPGFRFNPRDEEIITFYLTPKVQQRSFTCAAIGEINLNGVEPWELPGKANMGEKVWYFFNQKDRKYRKGIRMNRATKSGYWKATGKDKEIYRTTIGVVPPVLIGMKKTLVFYTGRAPNSQKTSWIMHEYRLEGDDDRHPYPAANSISTVIMKSSSASKDDWVVCRVFHKITWIKKEPASPPYNNAMDDIGIDQSSVRMPLPLEFPMLPDFMDPAGINYSITDVSSSSVPHVSPPGIAGVGITTLQTNNTSLGNSMAVAPQMPFYHQTNIGTVDASGFMAAPQGVPSLMVSQNDAGMSLDQTNAVDISSMVRAATLPRSRPGDYSEASTDLAAEKSRILVVGGTGCLGRHVVAASARLGHPTFALVRDTAPSDAAKAALLKSFQDAGVTLLKGDLDDHGSLVSAVRFADVVISTVGVRQIPDQTKLVAAIKEAGNVKRFVPSEFGLDADRSEAVEPTRSMITATKAGIRRAVEAAGVPYTPSSSATATSGWLVFVDEADIAAYTVLAAADPRAENKTLHIRPPANTLSHNELLALWEGKTGRALERVHVPEDAVHKQIQEASIPMNLMLSIGHATHIKGEQSKLGVDPASGVDAGELYPDVKYTTVDDYLNRLL
ncbi:hypothetical protein C2845_PM07G04020 [Panicum miliaceum]|uniref:NAC domain-containing protein n=1 Tax=Panicum miliaceum TaxID=4540 RepID=A0A3L6SIH6_PANMI|nr:hypothetical protein C2845_PM07G04020 [Panicum miliaceum]